MLVIIVFKLEIVKDIFDNEKHKLNFYEMKKIQRFRK